MSSVVDVGVEPKIGRRRAAAEVLDFERASAAGRVEEQDAGARVVDPGFDADVLGVDRVDHVGHRGDRRVDDDRRRFAVGVGNPKRARRRRPRRR